MARKNVESVVEPVAESDVTEVEGTGDPLEDAVDALKEIEAEREEAEQAEESQADIDAGSESGEQAEQIEPAEAEEEEPKPAIHHYMAGVPDADLNDDGTFKPGLQDWHEQWNRAYPGYTGPVDPSVREAPDKPSADSDIGEGEEGTQA